MTSKKFKAVLISGILAASVMALPISAMAEGETTAIQTQPKVTISKTVNAASGVTVPETDCTFVLTQTDMKEAAGLQNSDDTIQPATIGPITTTIKVSGTGTQTADIDFSSVTTPGEYTFTLKETAPVQKTGDFGWTVDPQEYIVRVYISSNGDKSYTIENRNKEKVDKAAFSNDYTKNGGENTEDKTALTIRKIVVGEYADPNTEYTFHITFTNATPNTVGIKDSTGKDYAYDTSHEFKLKKDESLVFATVPAGTTYTLTEDTATNVTKTEYEVTTNGSEAAKTETSPSGVLVGENENSVDVTNTYKDVTITGVTTSIAPFIAVIAAAAAAVALYAVAKRRMSR